MRGAPRSARRDRIGDLVLEDVGAPVPARIDDHLRVGEVGDRVEWDVPRRPNGDEKRRAGEEEHEHPVAGAEFDDALDHGRARA